MLTVAGPPLHLSPSQALEGLTLPELVLSYLYTRREQRKASAERLEGQALLVDVLAAMGGGNAKELCESLRAEATKLREPELAPPVRPLTPGLRRFLWPEYTDASEAD